MENPPGSLTTTEGAVLGLVAFGEASGYELARLAASSVAHIWTPSQSQIYKTLPRLAALGLTRVREIEQRGRPDKAVYRITRTGRGVLRRWLDDVEDEPAVGWVAGMTVPLPITRPDVDLHVTACQDAVDREQRGAKVRPPTPPAPPICPAAP